MLYVQSVILPHSTPQAAMEQRQRRSVQLRQLHELQASNEQRTQRQLNVGDRLKGLQVGGAGRQKAREGGGAGRDWCKFF